jgi:hypothetical protein
VDALYVVHVVLLVYGYVGLILVSPLEVCQFFLKGFYFEVALLWLVLLIINLLRALYLGVFLLSDLKIKI